MINTALVLGAVFMRALFRILYIEASRSRNAKSIVYMAHLEDLYSCRPAARGPFQWTDLLLSSKQGFRVRQVLYEKDPSKVATLAHAVIKMLRSAPHVRFVTVPESVKELDRTR
jgi:hypothetical protein